MDRPLPHLLILQHPQERRDERATLPLVEQSGLPHRLRVGLSWRSLAHAWGDPIDQAKRWWVFYLGSAKLPAQPGIYPLSRKGTPLAPADNNRPELGAAEGLIFLDGTWSQAKTLWWRNAWLLKCQRVAFTPAEPSLYGRLRKEPRSECVSTLESIVHALRSWDEARADALQQSFGSWCESYRRRGG